MDKSIGCYDCLFFKFDVFEVCGEWSGRCGGVFDRESQLRMMCFGSSDSSKLDLFYEITIS